ncbi:hypothetical protein [Paenibacillus humicus]|nr:hypothetical protein [Paenibacillus humicus]
MNKYTSNRINAQEKNPPAYLPSPDKNSLACRSQNRFAGYFQQGV